METRYSLALFAAFLLVSPRTWAADLSELRYDAERRDPAAAVGLSVAVGFGAGHFYADDREVGILHAVAQGAALGLAVGGGLAGGKPGEVMRGVGLVGFVVARSVEASTALGAAHRYNGDLVDLIDRCQIAALGGTSLPECARFSFDAAPAPATSPRAETYPRTSATFPPTPTASIPTGESP